MELSESYSNIGAQVIKDNLSPSADLDLIHRHELCGMVGDPEKIILRIKNYRDTVDSWDLSRGFFPGFIGL
ncbi:hypothetical protein [Pseudomonas sp. CC120222-01a]|uniref:hypothetical protein n=1 Tax=Pseudomonas sp. CC120222-01a TaxID=1378075 RepID=UPI0010582ACE|nr:hypothetical protein [Pseudomonas sp. CC120222-01a]